MDFSLIFADLFPGENVSPDMSTIEAIRAHWRGSSPCPSDEVIAAKWAEIAPAIEAAQADREAIQTYNAAGLTTDKLIIALWEKVMENRSIDADALQSARVSVKQSIQAKNL